MTNKEIQDITDIVSSNILTPIIYLLEENDNLDLICFCDRNITMQEIYIIENKISSMTGKNTAIIDIREFGEYERLDIISRAKLIHSEHPIIEQVFAKSMTDDYKIAMEEKKSTIERRKHSGSCFLQ